MRSSGSTSRSAGGTDSATSGGAEKARADSVLTGLAADCASRVFRDRGLERGDRLLRVAGHGGGAGGAVRGLRGRQERGHRRAVGIRQIGLRPGGGADPDEGAGNRFGDARDVERPAAVVAGDRRVRIVHQQAARLGDLDRQAAFERIPLAGLELEGARAGHHRIEIVDQQRRPSAPGALVGVQRAAKVVRLQRLVGLIQDRRDLAGRGHREGAAGPCDQRVQALPQGRDSRDELGAERLVHPGRQLAQLRVHRRHRGDRRGVVHDQRLRLIEHRPESVPQRLRPQGVDLAAAHQPHHGQGTTGVQSIEPVGHAVHGTRPSRSSRTATTLRRKRAQRRLFDRGSIRSRHQLVDLVHQQLRTPRLDEPRTDILAEASSATPRRSRPERWPGTRPS